LKKVAHPPKPPSAKEDAPYEKGYRKVPKGIQPKMVKALHEIWIADTREEAHRAFDLFIDK